MKEKKSGIGRPKMMYSLTLGKYNTLCLAQYYSGWWKHVSEEKTIVDGTEIPMLKKYAISVPIAVHILLREGKLRPYLSGEEVQETIYR